MTQPLFDKQLWKPCRDTVANGLAVGLFFAVLPIPAQSIFAAIAAMRMRSNVPFAMAACWLSNPFTNVPIWIGQLFLGNWVHSTFDLPLPQGQIQLPGFGTVPVGNFVLGSVVSGLLLALLAYPLVHLFSAILPHHLPVRKASLRRPMTPRVRRTDAS